MRKLKLSDIEAICSRLYIKPQLHDWITKQTADGLFFQCLLCTLARFLLPKLYDVRLILTPLLEHVTEAQKAMAL